MENLQPGTQRVLVEIYDVAIQENGCHNPNGPPRIQRDSGYINFTIFPLPVGEDSHFLQVL